MTRTAFLAVRAGLLKKDVIHVQNSRHQLHDHANSKSLCTCVNARRKVAVSVPEV